MERGRGGEKGVFESNGSIWHYVFYWKAEFRTAQVQEGVHKKVRRDGVISSSRVDQSPWQKGANGRSWSSGPGLSGELNGRVVKRDTGPAREQRGTGNLLCLQYGDCGGRAQGRKAPRAIRGKRRLREEKVGKSEHWLTLWGVGGHRRGVFDGGGGGRRRKASLQGGQPRGVSAQFTEAARMEERVGRS